MEKTKNNIQNNSPLGQNQSLPKCLVDSFSGKMTGTQGEKPVMKKWKLFFFRESGWRS